MISWVFGTKLRKKINPVRRLYRNKFVKMLEEQLDQINIKHELFEAIRSKPSRETMERIDIK